MCCSRIWLMYHKVTSYTLGITLPSLCPKFCYFILNTSSNPQWIHFQLSAYTHKSEDALRAKMSAYNQITFLRFSYFWNLSHFCFQFSLYMQISTVLKQIFLHSMQHFGLFCLSFSSWLLSAGALACHQVLHIIHKKFFLNSFFSTTRIGILSSLTLSLVPRS